MRDRLHDESLNMDGDLFPWKFDLNEELVEFFSNASETRRFLIRLRFLYVIGLMLSSVFIIGLNIHEKDVTQGLLAFVIIYIIFAWLIWKLFNELRFFCGFLYWRKKYCLWK
jgi:hypothetical protein